MEYVELFTERELEDYHCDNGFPKNSMSQDYLHPKLQSEKICISEEFSKQIVSMMKVTRYTY